MKRLAIIVDGEVVMAIPLLPVETFTDEAAQAIMDSNPKVVITEEVISAGHIWDGTSFSLPEA